MKRLRDWAWNKLLDWILPPDMWEGFYLDPWVPVRVRLDDKGNIVFTQIVQHEFWEQIKDVYGKTEE